MFLSFWYRLFTICLYVLFVSLGMSGLCWFVFGGSCVMGVKCDICFCYACFSAVLFVCSFCDRMYVLFCLFVYVLFVGCCWLFFMLLCVAGVCFEWFGVVCVCLYLFFLFD